MPCEKRGVLQPQATLLMFSLSLLMFSLSLPLMVDVVVADRPIWTKEVASNSALEDVSAEGSAYAETRKLSETEMPYDGLEEQRLRLRAAGEEAGCGAAGAVR
jgi:hypothetical protein